MELKAWIKQNPFILATAALPVIVVTLFVLATAIPNATVDAPKYDVLFTVQQYRAQTPYTVAFTVDNGNLLANVTYTREGHYPTQKLLRYRSATDSVEEIEVTLPLVDDTETDSQIVAVAIDGLLIDAPLAPDGYGYRVDLRRGGLFTELFGMSRRHLVGLHKSGRVIPIELPSDIYPYINSTELVAWVGEAQ